MNEYLYGTKEDDTLDVDPYDVLERIWDGAEPRLEVGAVIEVHQWEALPAERMMPDVDLLLDHYGEMVYEQYGEECYDTIKWDSPGLRGAAAHFVAEMNRHIHWMSAGKRVSSDRYRLVDADVGNWALEQESA